MLGTRSIFPITRVWIAFPRVPVYAIFRIGSLSRRGSVPSQAAAPSCYLNVPRAREFLLRELPGLRPLLLILAIALRFQGFQALLIVIFLSLIQFLAGSSILSPCPPTWEREGSTCVRRRFAFAFLVSRSLSFAPRPLTSLSPDLRSVKYSLEYLIFRIEYKARHF